MFLSELGNEVSQYSHVTWAGLDDLSFVPPSSKNRAFLPIFGRGVPLTCPTGCQNVEATVFFFEEPKAYGESDLVEASGGSFIC